MNIKDKKELFLHWLVYQCDLKLFSKKLTFSETKHLYHLLVQTKMSDIEKRTGSKLKTIKHIRGFIYKKIRPELMDEARSGKDNIFYNLLFNVIPSSIEDDFFTDWKSAYKRKSSKEDPDKDFFYTLPQGALPSSVKSFDRD